MSDRKTMHRVQVSEIINTVSSTDSSAGYLGFIITYPDGHIENRILDYDVHSFGQVQIRIRSMHREACRLYGTDKQEQLITSSGNDDAGVPDTAHRK